MKNTLKIQGRGIGKVKEAIELTLKLLEEHPDKDKLHIIADIKNHQGYINALNKSGIKTEIVEQNENYVVLKCKK